LRHPDPVKRGRGEMAKLSKANLDTPLTEIASSPWSPFHHAIFAVVWIATVVSNIGGWMYSAASGWLMTSLNPDPLIVSLVQVANTLSMFLFAVPAGALADILDKRKFLIVGESSILVVSTIFAVIVW
jgi:MFS family permease